MKYYKDYNRVIATIERSGGNEVVGDMWIETKSFDKTETIETIIEWAQKCSGRLIITIDEAGTEETSY